MLSSEPDMKHRLRGSGSSRSRHLKLLPHQKSESRLAVAVGTGDVTMPSPPSPQPDATPQAQVCEEAGVDAQSTKQPPVVHDTQAEATVAGGNDLKAAAADRPLPQMASSVVNATYEL